jgi:hypothetical protein
MTTLHTGIKRKFRQEKKYKCPEDGCQISFDIPSQLVVHMAVHSTAKPFVCDFPNCKCAYKGRSDLLAHKRLHTNKKITCQENGCAYSCSKPSHLASHMVTHSEARPFICDFKDCQTTYKTKAHLLNHKRCHSNEGSFVCDFDNCFYAGNSSRNLASHKLKHSGERNFVCDFENCGKACKSLSNLKQHKRVHTKETPYSCDFPKCTYATSNPGYLKTHARVHSREKPFVCDFIDCGQEFSVSSNLVRHKLLHQETKSHACEHCPYKSTRIDSLRRHAAVHERQSNYKIKCTMQDGGNEAWTEGDVECTIRCETQRHLEYHIQRNHTMEGISSKLASERKLCDFFTANGVVFDRDWANLLKFKGCKNIEGGKSFARPDFYLPVESARLKAVVLGGNDEYSHRQNACDLQRTFNMTQSLDQTEEYGGLPLLYVRFNPHYFKKGDTYYDLPLKVSHEIFLKTIRSLQPEDLKEGLNLIYINYDRDKDGNLTLFQIAKEQQNDFGTILEPCVLRIV